MIVKNFEINKLNFNLKKILLFYGKNEGLKSEIIRSIIKNKKNINFYEEKEIIENVDFFIETIMSKSLFDNEKTIIIKRVTDKFLSIINEIKEKNLDDLTIIVNAENLDKKSKLRNFFEKDKDLVCVPFYPDTEQTLSKIAYNFLKEKKILISSSNINLIVSKCGRDREILLNELSKLEYYNKNGKKLTTENILKLINLIENHSVSELVDNCLAKNKKKIISILNENNFNNEDNILIIRTFLNKTKKIQKLCNEFENNKNIELTISSAKPPIFWKDKLIVKQQLLKWNSKSIKKLIYKISEVELISKTNIYNSINLINNFIFEIASSETNN